MMFSLVVATRGRTAELTDLFVSLAAGQGAPFELILVDQNGDARLDPIVAAAPIPVRHLGDIVAFPDDDCILPAGTLARVAAAFADPALAVLTGPSAAPEGGLGSGRWRGESGPITLGNVWTSVIEFNLWIRRDLALALGGFDEAMGPGARFGSAEGNDLVCRAMAAGAAARYDFDLRVIHPDKRLTPEAVERAHRYGLGLGFALRRHPVPVSARLTFLIRPAGGAVLSLLRGQVLEARYYLATLRGRAAGMLSAPVPPPGPLEPL